MAERAEFLRLYQEGTKSLLRATDQDQFQQWRSAFEFYIQGANCYNKAIHIPLPPSQQNDDTRKATARMQSQMEGSIKRVNQILDANPEFCRSLFPEKYKEINTTPIPVTHITYPLPPPALPVYIPPLEEPKISPVVQMIMQSSKVSSQGGISRISSTPKEPSSASSVLNPARGIELRHSAPPAPPAPSAKSSNPTSFSFNSSTPHSSSSSSSFSSSSSSSSSSTTPTAHNPIASSSSSARLHPSQPAKVGYELLLSVVEAMPKEQCEAAVSLLSSLERKMIEAVANEMVVGGEGGVTFEDIVGCDKAKKLLDEMVLYPIIRPDLFEGIRAPPRGLLLFGPPGTGKTLLCRALCNKAECRFFSLSASSLTSKWVGEGEKMVRTLFRVAEAVQPSIVFIDEIDSILSERSSTDNESSIRMKTEFLVNLDGLSSSSSSSNRVVFIGATNRPFDLDTAVLRRLPRRVYLPLPDANGRVLLLKHTLSKTQHSLSEADFEWLAKQTEMFSNADIVGLCKDAALAPVREVMSNIRSASSNNIRPVSIDDLKDSLKTVRPSSNPSSLVRFEQWNKEYGSG
ncbi:p97J [Monocercomonoides exilis]|uniref:p97J n=1 Tax=Monocercomonoides exilis TaxID=2049356 RepID=UPI0035597858|nr:p97J [Monocercomonoides exilis]|eukprot:MONOS_15688.1-p1 / transcript=MONOS_15688.1 / gene=MONOS_15688 / organism=Monocercomonoides_exilis_PA203 / gene_product=p97J / transcript_product=p97J / location=Mono_scaffold01312:1612-6884(+) / protein_length=573 / sequence_SO=supercontig / SO=protein_coding / is_pseudo=false